MGFPGGSAGKETICNVGDMGSIPGLGRLPWRKEWLPTPVLLQGFPGGASGKEPACQCKSYTRCRFESWVGKIWTEQPGGLKSIASQSRTLLKQLSATQHVAIVIVAFLSRLFCLFFSLKNIEFCFSMHVGNLGSTQFFEGLLLNLLRQV